MAEPAAADAGCPGVNDPEHAWNRGFGFWHLLFWASLAIGLVITWAAGDVLRGHRIVATAAIVTLGGAYALLRPQAADALTTRNLTYLGIVIVAVSVTCGAIPALSILLTAAFSQMWLFSGPTRNGAILSGVLAAGTLIGLITASGWSSDTVWTLSAVMLISVAVSIGFGVWISRIIDQSKDRALLIQELESARSQLGAAHHAQGVMAERERLAREIHDTLAQGFTSVIMLAQSALAVVERSPADAAAKLASIEDVARENLAEARALVAAFSPVALEGSTLADALGRLAGRFARETGLAISLDLPPDPVALEGLSRESEVVLLRAVQESLANVRRHAQATAVTVRLTAPPSSTPPSSTPPSSTPPGSAPPGDHARLRQLSTEVWVEVTDNGVGFDAGSEAGYGLSGMRHRVQDAGGAVDVESSPGAGTRVVVRVPA